VVSEILISQIVSLSSKFDNPHYLQNDLNFLPIYPATLRDYAKLKTRVARYTFGGKIV